MRAISSLVPLCGDGALLRLWARRGALALALAAGLGASAATEATAFTLRLAFADGQPMTYGSACAGVGCLQRNDGVAPTDERGEVWLPGNPRTVEYRRNGIRLGLVTGGLASGTVLTLGDRATVTLPRMLVGSRPTVDEVESDLIARLNEARAAQGLTLAQLNPKLSMAADMQATWLATTGVTFTEPARFHEGPFESDMAFRHGEVSLPDPASGGEIAEAGGTVAETVSDWLSSAQHRELILAPGRLLVGAGMAGAFTIVQTHRLCDGCAQEGTGTRSTPRPVAAPPPGAPGAPGAPVPATPAAAPAATIGSSLLAPAPPPPPPPCREQLTTRRLKNSGGRVRLRVTTRCLRRGARYSLLVRQGTAGKILRTVRIARAGTMLVGLRPTRSATRLRITFKRDGHVIVARTMSLRT